MNTMVLISPMRRESQAATGKEKAERTPDQEEQARGAKRQIEALEEPERQQRLDDEAPGKGIEAESAASL